MRAGVPTPTIDVKNLRGLCRTVPALRASHRGARHILGLWPSPGFELDEFGDFTWKALRDMKCAEVPPASQPHRHWRSRPSRQGRQGLGCGAREASVQSRSWGVSVGETELDGGWPWA